jgi:hypothetical protein
MPDADVVMRLRLSGDLRSTKNRNGAGATGHYRNRCTLEILESSCPSADRPLSSGARPTRHLRPHAVGPHCMTALDGERHRDRSLSFINGA